MASTLEEARVREELVEAIRLGDEARARTLVPRLGTNPQQVRVVLEGMLTVPDARVRQAAVFGLGELGGAASTRCLERQLTVEETRGDYDGVSVAEVITQALGRIKDKGARASLVRRMERLVSGNCSPADVNTVACALWKRRHPDLLPAVQRSLRKLATPPPGALLGLLVLLEKSPEELGEWVRDPSVPVEHKTEVLIVLEEEVPGALLATLPSFIFMAHTLVEPAVRQDGAAAYYCECLFSLLLLHKARLLPALTEEALSLLRDVARSLVAALSPNCSIRATALLQFVGRPEDADVIEANRPADPIGARSFDDVARALRHPRKI
jgi:hypothetical protein